MQTDSDLKLLVTYSITGAQFLSLEKQTDTDWFIFLDFGHDKSNSAINK